MNGTYTWPSSSGEEWRTSRRGAKPSCSAWAVSEKAPAITACEAITAAAVASRSSGGRAQSGAWLKNV